MKINFLGTSAAWPLPRLGCTCKICSSDDPKDKRLRSSILIDDHVLIDAGFDIYHQLKRYSNESGWKITNLSDILITHSHFDHICGIPDLTKIYNLPKKLALYAPKSTMTAIRNYFGVVLTALKQEVVKAGKSFSIGNLQITFFEVEHGRTPTYGIKVKGNKILAYIPDFSRIRPSSKQIIKGVDIAIFDGSSLCSRGQARDHISMVDGVKLASELRIKKTYFTHIGHKTGRDKFLAKYLSENSKTQVQAAYDNLEIKI